MLVLHPRPYGNGCNIISKRLEAKRFGTKYPCGGMSISDAMPAQTGLPDRETLPGGKPTVQREPKEGGRNKFLPPPSSHSAPPLLARNAALSLPPNLIRDEG